MPEGYLIVRTTTQEGVSWVRVGGDNRSGDRSTSRRSSSAAAVASVGTVAGER